VGADRLWRYSQHMFSFLFFIIIYCIYSSAGAQYRNSGIVDSDVRFWIELSDVRWWDVGSS